MANRASKLPPDPPESGQSAVAERLRRGLPIELSTDEQASAQQVITLLRQGGSVLDPKLFPEPLRLLIEHATEMLARGEAVSLVHAEKLLSTEEAAALLDVSRQYLVRLLDAGTIPGIRTGSHRRVAAADVLAYKERRDAERRLGLRELTKMSREAGGYKEIKRLR